MRSNNFTVSAMPQNERDAITGEFRDRTTLVLITTEFQQVFVFLFCYYCKSHLVGKHLNLYCFVLLKMLLIEIGWRFEVYCNVFEKDSSFLFYFIAHFGNAMRYDCFLDVIGLGIGLFFFFFRMRMCVCKN